MERPPASLQARALAWLAQREHSRGELRRKLLRLARRQPDPHDVAPAAPPDAASSLADQVEALLDRLEAQGLLSERRFVESRVRARAPGAGTRHIEMELAQHGLKLDAATLKQLRDSEYQRALRLWQRRFTAAPADPRERARQMRFLNARGFAADVIRRVLAAALELPDDASR